MLTGAGSELRSTTHSYLGLLGAGVECGCKRSRLAQAETAHEIALSCDARSRTQVCGLRSLVVACPYPNTPVQAQTGARVMRSAMQVWKESTSSADCAAVTVFPLRAAGLCSGSDIKVTRGR